jgi:hypothetical protein
MTFSCVILTKGSLNPKENFYPFQNVYTSERSYNKCLPENCCCSGGVSLLKLVLFQVSRHVDMSQHMTRILEGSISGSPTIISAITSSPLDDVMALAGGQAKVIFISYN